MSFRLDRTTVSLAAAFLTALAGSGEAFAQSTADPGSPVKVTGKGIVGGGLLGAEVVDITMGAIGVERGWPYFVFGGLGAVGGAVGGYAVEKASSNGEAPMYMLAGGMALVIPMLVVSLNATAYKPPETERNEPVDNKPAAEPPGKASLKVTAQSQWGRERPQTPASGDAKTEAPRIHLRNAAAFQPAFHIPVSLVDVYGGRLAMGLPAFELRPLYSQREMWLYGVGQGQELRVPVFKASF